MISLFIASLLITTVAANGNPLECDDEQSPICPPGYNISEREGGVQWCIKYVAGNLSFFEAEQKCRCDGGATLSGIQNQREYRLIISEIEKAFEEQGIENGSVWLGAYRRKSCRGPISKWQNKTECAKENIFQWIDKNTRGRFVFKHFADGAPQSSIVNHEQENCLTLSISTSAESGSLDDQFCSLKNVTQGFVCGRPAKVSVQRDNGYGGGGGYGGNGQIGNIISALIGSGNPNSK